MWGVSQWGEGGGGRVGERGRGAFRREPDVGKVTCYDLYKYNINIVNNIISWNFSMHRSIINNLSAINSEPIERLIIQAQQGKPAFLQ